ncbi:MAG: ABC transporter ATP-binding protein [Bacteroidales bacterium]|jgi:ABC-2 type transport system ATP-binding protein|nr:ABC transporter ATP-binding protein [Bacteroidales bacterium]
MQNLIKINNLSFRYGKKNHVFDSLNIEFKAGNIYGLLGENGVGKTTLLRLISGLLFPVNGNIEVMGNTPGKREPGFLEEIYYLPEVFNSPPITLEEYAKINKLFYPKFNDEQFRYYVNELGVDQSKKLSKMSYGQQKKAIIAFALSCNTSLLLLDEPTNGLDIPSKTVFRRLIAGNIDLNKCFIISTHQVRDLENMIDPIVILEQNQILLNNSIEDITKHLWFGIRQHKSEHTFYAEDALGGYNLVERNTTGEDSKVNIEMLFNSAICNKKLYKEIFINPKSSTDNE